MAEALIPVLSRDMNSNIERCNGVVFVFMVNHPIPSNMTLRWLIRMSWKMVNVHWVNVHDGGVHAMKHRC